tara:strand:- start:16332 stop:16571 length:240 start_codon:yes stop_codon:yes gene_type:complete
MIIIYFLIGLVAFCALQFQSKYSHEGSGGYQMIKGAAWLSLLAWPLVGACLGIALVGVGISKGIGYLDDVINRIIRSKK